MKNRFRHRTAKLAAATALLVFGTCVSYAQETLTAPQQQAVTAAANELLKTSAAEGIDALMSAAKTGNRPAARRLVDIYISGLGSRLPRDTAAARDLLGQFEDVLTESEINFRHFLIAVAEGEALSTLGDKLSELSDNQIGSAALRSLTINENAYVFVVQSSLVGKGLYSGTTHGRLTAATIRAINELCTQAEIAPDCSAGPLNMASARAITSAL